MNHLNLYTQATPPNMSIHYNINPELNLLIVTCQGTVTPADFYKIRETITPDALYKRGMLILIDLFAADMDFELSDMYRVTASIEGETAPLSVAILTHSIGLHHTGDAMQLLMGQSTLNIRMFYTIDDAIVAFGLLAAREAILQFWQSSQPA